MKDFKKLREQALRQNYRKKEVFVEGDVIMNALTGQKGTIHRAGSSESHLECGNGSRNGLHKPRA